MKAGDSFESRLEYITTRLVSRSFREQEIAISKTSLDDLLSWYSQHPEEAQAVLEVGNAPLDTTLPAPETAAWTLLVNQLMNLDEVLVK